MLGHLSRRRERAWHRHARKYASGPIAVLGFDICGLDRDGIARE